MTDVPEIPETRVSVFMRPLGSEPVEKHLTLGTDPCIIIEPVESEDGFSFTLDSTGIDKENAVMVLQMLAQTLQETELKQIEEG